MDIAAKQKLRDFLVESLEKHGDKNPLSDTESIFVSLLDSVDAIEAFVESQR